MAIQPNIHNAVIIVIVKAHCVMNSVTTGIPLVAGCYAILNYAMSTMSISNNPKMPYCSSVLLVEDLAAVIQYK